MVCMENIQNRKFVKRTGLNEKAIELVEKYKQYMNLEENDALKVVLSYYIENKLNFKIKDIQNFKTEEELISYLNSNKCNLISEKEQIEESIDFANEILDLDRLKIGCKTNVRTKSLIFIKKIGLNMDESKKIFCKITRDDFEKEQFVYNFVDKYMRKNAELFISTIVQDGFSISLGKIYNSSCNDWNFDMIFSIKIDDLDELNLIKIGRILANFPKFA